MKRIILSLFIFMLVGSITIATAYSGNNYEIKPITLAKGSFIRANIQREISTATNRIGDEVRLIATSPTFAGEGLIIPEKTLFIGKISELYQPIEGANGAMRVKINKIIFPSEDEMLVEGIIWAKNKNLIGGELTQPAYYTKMPHFTFRWGGGCLAFQDSGIYKVGVPTIVKAGTELLIMLEQDTDFFPYEL